MTIIGNIVVCNWCKDVLIYKPFTDCQIFCKCGKVSITKNNIYYMDEGDFTEYTRTTI